MIKQKPQYFDGATGERGDVVMVYRQISVWKEPDNERETVSECVAYAMTQTALINIINMCNRQGAIKSPHNPYQFWRYEIISLDNVK